MVALADGSIHRGFGFGHVGSAVGEICFNTAMTGYQEVLSDPSYRQQIVVFTAPHIGNTGVNDEDVEGDRESAVGAIQRCEPTPPSNWRSHGALGPWLAGRRQIGLWGVDTRALTLRIRERGMQGAAIVHHPDGIMDTDDAVGAARAFGGLAGVELAMAASAQAASGAAHRADRDAPLAIVIDFGVKQGIVARLAARGFRVELARADSTAASVLARRPDGIVLSNGPGDPAATARYAASTVRTLIDSGLPLLGICLGHQVLAITLGGHTRKMAQGHHGANHPVKNLLDGSIEICSMNHGFSVEVESLPPGVTPTHRSLFDGSNCGLRVEGKPCLSVQHHPEAGPGPRDAERIFDRFARMVAEHRAAGGAAAVPSI